MLNTRKQNLLKTIIDEYYKTANPVPSNLICKISDLKLSSATIRNEMAELEKMGYVVSPHTSAGRIPTEKGYQYYIDNFCNQSDSTCKFYNLSSNEFARQDIKEIAKKIADLTSETILVAFAKNDLYYTGIRNLFSKPEFKNFDLIYNLSEVLEQLDEVVKELYEQVDENVQIFIGSKNPIDKNCSTLISKYNDLFFAIIGPMRMNYIYNKNLMLCLKKFIKNNYEK